MMVTYHVINDNAIYPPENWFFSFFSIKGQPAESILAEMGQLCVSIFAFNTGFVIYKLRELYRDYKFIFKRIVNLLLAYWIIWIPFLAIGMALELEMPDPIRLIKNAFGLNLTVAWGPINIWYAWYVCYYIFIMLTAPFIILLFSKTKWYVDFAIFAIFIYFTPYLPFRIVQYLWPEPSTFLGFMVSKYGIFYRVRIFFKQKPITFSFISSLLLFLFALTLRYYEQLLPTFLLRHRYDALVALIFILSFLLIIDYMPKYFSSILVFLGSISMCLWFSQGFFAIDYNIKRFFFFPYYPPLIILWSLFLLVPISYLFFTIHKYITSKLFRHKVKDKSYSAV